MKTPKELTQQAYELYYIIRVQKLWAAERSERKKRLHFVGLRAFHRFVRRQKAQGQEDIDVEREQDCSGARSPIPTD